MISITDEELVSIINQQKSMTKTASIIGCCLDTLRKRVRNNNLQFDNYRNKISYDVSVFTREDATSYYLLGAFITDGCISQDLNRATITSVDEDWLVQIKNITSPKSIITKSNNTKILALHNKEIVKWLYNNKCIPNKSLVVEFPNIPKIYMRDFIRGVLDGDGFISCKFYKNESKFSQYLGDYCYKYIMCGIASASEKFTTTLSSILLEEDFPHKLYKKETANLTNKNILQKHPIYDIRFNNTKAYNFLKWIYYPDHKISLGRKYNKAKEIFTYYQLASRLGKE